MTVKELIAYIKEAKAKASIAYDNAKAGELQTDDPEAKRDFLIEEVFYCSQAMAYHDVLKRLEEN